MTKVHGPCNVDAGKLFKIIEKFMMLKFKNEFGDCPPNLERMVNKFFKDIKVFTISQLVFLILV